VSNTQVRGVADCGLVSARRRAHREISTLWRVSLDSLIAQMVVGGVAILFGFGKSGALECVMSHCHWLMRTRYGDRFP